MKRLLKTGGFVLLVLLFAVSLTMVVRRGLDYRTGEQVYTEAETLANLPDWTDTSVPEETTAPEDDVPPSGETPAEAPEETAGEVQEPSSVPATPDPYQKALQAMDFTALQEVNPEVLGWILIPGTAISYPIVQGTDNTYYLTHTWKKTVSAVGAIFLEAQNHADFSDGNTILYGHRMNNGSMFAALKYYKKQSYWAAHPEVYLTDRQGSRRYEIFAAYEVPTSGAAYQIGFSGAESKEQFLEDCLSRSVISTGITPAVSDRILTLSTCTGRGHATRWVVQARLPTAAAEPSESAEPEGTNPETDALSEGAEIEATAGTDVPADADASEESEEMVTEIMTETVTNNPEKMHK